MPPMPTHIPSSSSRLPNQHVVTQPPPSHHLSAADDLISRFQLHSSYRIMLHPFRKDLHTAAVTAAAGQQKGEANGNEAQNSADGKGSTIGQDQTDRSSMAAAIDPASVPGPQALPRTFAHFLPPSLPGRVKPQKPPRQRLIASRKAALAATEMANANPDGQAAGAGISSSANVSGAASNALHRERNLAKAQQEWEKNSTTLRRVVMKPEFTPAEIRAPLDADVLRGFQVEAGDVDEIDRSLLEADPAHEQSSPKRKKAKKSGGGPDKSGGGKGGPSLAHKR